VKIALAWDLAALLCLGVCLNDARFITSVKLKQLAHLVSLFHGVCVNLSSVSSGLTSCSTAGYKG
jgi:hypothetical protein